MSSYGISSFIGSGILAIISYIIFLKNIESITKINTMIVPILIMTIILIGIKNIQNINLNQIGENTRVDKSLYWFVQSIIYASYNMILLIPVLISLKKLIKNQKQIIYVSIIAGVIMAIISILTFLLLINVDTSFAELEMPVIYVIERNFAQFKYIYGITILIAIFTTAISVGISFLSNNWQKNKSYSQVAKIMCITSVIISPIGFSNLVKILFPIFGYLGLIQIYFIAKTK